MLENDNNICRQLHTCVAAYAIERGVTRPFNRRVVATSRRLEVISVAAMFSFEAEEGDVNM